MPKGDRTGPAGMGPMTGRGAGLCGGNPVPGYMNQGLGRGMGRGRGHRNRFFAGMPGWRGMGWSGHFVADAGPTAADEIEILKQQAAFLEKSLAGVNQRLRDLEKDKDTDA